MTTVDDDYTGHVDPGTAARRTLPGATILKASVGPIDNNAYLVTCATTGETLLIDAANDADVLIDLIRRYAPKVSLIVTSHQHFDHWQALQAVAEATGAPTAAHQIDADPLPVRPDRFLANGDTVRIGELTFDVIHLRGHTPGSVALALDGRRPAGHAVVHRRLPVPRWSRQDLAARRFHPAAHRRHHPGVRRVRRLHRHLSRPW
ncbi:metallo-beta-lactamase superfamily protein [Mycobacterium kansasii]|uniref:Metallo-beta-lactamase superfamily protein n=1 Tax=Mycobacterium kansasii TaxID=1768 RepID=A0A1V3XCR8_MYCKA|nr:metallo-beta-lactamase superfamily protein [Mycobacterium kansasii]